MIVLSDRGAGRSVVPPGGEDSGGEREDEEGGRRYRTPRWARSLAANVVSVGGFSADNALTFLCLYNNDFQMTVVIGWELFSAYKVFLVSDWSKFWVFGVAEGWIMLMGVWSCFRTHYYSFVWLSIMARLHINGCWSWNYIDCMSCFDWHLCIRSCLLSQVQFSGGADQGQQMSDGHQHPTHR